MQDKVYVALSSGAYASDLSSGRLCHPARGMQAAFTDAGEKR
jgi:hypothetical protein